jgi:hypothetical protein
MVHGGGHVMLSRDDIRPKQTGMLLDNGFLPYQYRLQALPETTLPDSPMIDVVNALAWVRTVLPNTVLARRDISVDAERSSW